MTDTIGLLFGGVLLYFGAEWLVAGASRLALSLRIPPLVVGLTVVAYGTSSPELIVGVEAAIQGHGSVALGNVIGSNIANIGLILGVSTVIRPATVDPALQRRELPVLLTSTLLLPAALWDGRIGAWDGIALLALAFGYTVAMVRTTRTASADARALRSLAQTAYAADRAGAPSGGSRGRLATTAAVGLAVLIVGGRVFVDAATGLAISLGVSQRIVGMTIVAIGTSLPELATSVVASRRGHSEIAVGNVVGSNIFNVLLCLGASASARPIEVPMTAVWGDLVCLSGMTLLMAVFLRTQRTMTRHEGIALLLAYGAFLATIAMR